MQVVVNGTLLLSPLTGIGQYIRQLFGAIAAERRDIQVRYFCGREFVDVMPDAVLSESGMRRLARHFIPNARAFYRNLQQRAFIRQTHPSDPARIYHEPGQIAFPYDGPLVLTVHDLSCFDHPETHPKDRVQLLEREMPNSLARAERIVVVSQATSLALRRRFYVPEAKIRVTPLAAGLRFHPRPHEELVAPLAEMKLVPGEYLLSVGTLEPRKNLPTLFAAYSLLPGALRQRFPLVVAGLPGWHRQGLLKAAETLVRKGDIRFLGYVPDDRLPLLYSGAAAFAYPSRYEGFGLPPLEAMASGVPVIVANTSSLPEVVGEAGLMLDPDDVDGFSAGLEYLLDNREEAARYVGLGLAQAATFSWRRCAQETLAVYREILALRGALDLG